MSSEKLLANEIKKALPKGSFFQKIENRVASGFPDLFILLNGIPLFIELKAPIKGNRIKCEKSQIAWHLRYNACKGVSFFLLRVPLTSDLILFDGGIVARSIAQDCEFPKSATLCSRKNILETLTIATSYQTAIYEEQIMKQK
jgi:hypothetical protein